MFSSKFSLLHNILEIDLLVSLNILNYKFKIDGSINLNFLIFIPVYLFILKFHFDYCL